MSKTTALLEQLFTRKQISFLKKLSLKGWRSSIARAARKAGGRTSFTPAKWLELNKTRSGISKSEGRNEFGYCGAACWLYAAIKNSGAEEKHYLRYYEDKEHITVMTPAGKEIDVTAPQHAFGKSGNFKKAKNVKQLGFTEIEEDRKTWERFRKFAEDFAGAMEKNK